MLRSRWALIGLLLSANARAEPATATSIWYRSSDRCPDGVAFLERLEQLGRSARLADAGDTIDFVVTLGSKGGGSFGRLERQTERGTVAIREVEAPACVEVADALALSLDLALDPRQGADALPPAPPPAPPAPEVAGGSEAAAPQTTPGVSEAQAPLSAHPARQTASAPAPPTAPSAEHDQAPHVAEAGVVARLGAQGTLVTGVGEAPLFGAAVFGELPLGLVTPRVSVWGATGASTVADSALRMWLFAARLEGCLGPFGARRLYFHPCAGADVGVVSARYAAENGGQDTGAWISPTLLGRGSWSFLERVTLEAQIGLYVPLFSYEVGEPGQVPLASTDRVGVQAAVGLGVAL
ncbi:MAG TPA: hypothetical protein VI197_18275 [Polyangiaceae bacterium]